MLSTDENQADFRALLRRFFQQVRGRILLALLCMVGYAAMELLSPWPLKLIFDHILLAKPLPHSLAWLNAVMQSGKPMATLLVSSGILVIALLGGVFASSKRSCS